MQVGEFKRIAMGAVTLSAEERGQLQELARMRTIPPFEQTLQTAALRFSHLGLLTVEHVKSDNLRGGGGFVRCLLTAEGERRAVLAH